ncbi:bacillithiol system redox-active protein YtxJ [Tenacibaculum sp. UWU-22]|uniref:bacillithiol system redox-active protein YtxJ n=1 Tax=Tenacibaculum sp. UWU-22 TaxID=3234187 RepID=UPI0034DB104C
MKFLRNNKNQEKKVLPIINWISFTSIEEIATIKQQSETKPVIIFKHSTRCAISRMVLKQLENNFSNELQGFQLYYLDLLNYRSVSNEVSNTFNVIHESPQILIIKNGNVVAHASHYEILEIDFAKFTA